MGILCQDPVRRASGALHAGVGGVKTTKTGNKIKAMYAALDSVILLKPSDTQSKYQAVALGVLTAADGDTGATAAPPRAPPPAALWRQRTRGSRAALGQRRCRTPRHAAAALGRKRTRNGGAALGQRRRRTHRRASAGLEPRRRRTSA